MEIIFGNGNHFWKWKSFWKMEIIFGNGNHFRKWKSFLEMEIIFGNGNHFGNGHIWEIYINSIIYNMYIIVNDFDSFNGWFGNQLFQIATLIAYCIENKTDFVLPYSETLKTGIRTTHILGQFS